MVMSTNLKSANRLLYKSLDPGPKIYMFVGSSNSG